MLFVFFSLSQECKKYLREKRKGRAHKKKRFIGSNKSLNPNLLFCVDAVFGYRERQETIFGRYERFSYYPTQNSHRITLLIYG
jgi:hypothetical protein